MDNRRHGDSLVRACLHQQVCMLKAGLRYDEADESGILPSLNAASRKAQVGAS